MGIIDAIRGERVYLDTNVFIYALEEYPRYVQALTELFDSIDAGRLKAITSELTLAEALVKPMMDGNAALQRPTRAPFSLPTPSMWSPSAGRSSSKPPDCGPQPPP